MASEIMLCSNDDNNDNDYDADISGGETLHILHSFYTYALRVAFSVYFEKDKEQI